jgi:hypothetical protein
MASPNAAVTQSAVAVGLEDLRNSESICGIPQLQRTAIDASQTMSTFPCLKRRSVPKAWVSLL